MNPHTGDTTDPANRTTTTAAQAAAPATGTDADTTVATAPAGPGATTRPALPRGVTRRTLTDGRDVYLVQDGTGTQRRSATFTLLEDAAAYKTYLATCRQQAVTALDPDQWRQTHRGTNTRRGITLRELLDGAVTEKTRSRPRSSRSYHTHRRIALGVLQRAGIDTDTRRRNITGETARAVRDQLAADGYATGSATPVLELFNTGARLAVDDRRIDRNPFDGLRAINQTGTRRPGHIGRKAAAFDTSHIAAVAGILPREYRLPYWLAVIAGLRISEIFGLHVEDWNPDTGWLSIRRQRRSGPDSVSETTKTEAGQRQIPLPRWLGHAIDAYILEHHTPAGTDDGADPGTLLVVGTRNRRTPHPMDPDALRTNIRNALTHLGLDSAAVGGDVAPVHHLRSTMISWLAGDPDVPPAMLSVYVGHRTTTTGDLGIQPASKTTRYYTKATSDGLRRVADGMQRLIETSLIAEHGIDDPIDISGPRRPVTIDTAATILAVDTGEVHRLVRDGELAARRIDTAERSTVVVDEDDVRHLAAECDRLSQDTLPSTEAARRLGVALGVLRQLIEDGELDGYGDPRDQPKLRGVPGGNLRGGQRVTIASIECFEAAHPERGERIDTWLTVGEAARTLGCSADTIRRQCDRGELTVWTDPYNHRSERRLDPQQIAELAAQKAGVTVDEVARDLNLSVRTVRRRVGQLRRNTPGGAPTIGRRADTMSADEYRQIAQNAGTYRTIADAVKILQDLIEQGRLDVVLDEHGNALVDTAPLER